MRFGYPYFTYLGFAILTLVLFHVWSFRKRRNILKHFIQKEFLPELTANYDEGKRKFKSFLMVSAVSLLFITLMRPQWGFQWQEVRRKGLDIIIALDTSNSMLAQDVKPNRLERSRLAIKDLVKKLKGDRVGLIAFSGTAFLQCPLTLDYNGFLLSLQDLDVKTIPRGGTSISSAIREAIKSYEGDQQKYKVLIVITDGEDHEGNPLREAERAKKDGMKIFCIGIGTKEGDLIPLRSGGGKQVFLKDSEGNVIKTRLDENTLQEIALMTGGSYVRSTQSEFGLGLIYEERLSKMEKREIESKMKKKHDERFQIPLGIAFLLLMLESVVGDRRRGK